MDLPPPSTPMLGKLTLPPTATSASGGVAKSPHTILHAAIQEATNVKYPTDSSTPRPPTTTTTKLIVVTGRSRRLAVENHRKELKELMSEHEFVGAEVRKTIGDVGTAFVVAGVGSGVVVVQAAGVGGLE